MREIQLHWLTVKLYIQGSSLRCIFLLADNAPGTPADPRLRRICAATAVWRRTKNDAAQGGSAGQRSGNRHERDGRKWGENPLIVFIFLQEDLEITSFTLFIRNSWQRLYVSVISFSFKPVWKRNCPSKTHAFSCPRLRNWTSLMVSHHTCSQPNIITVCTSTLHLNTIILTNRQIWGNFATIAQWSPACEIRTEESLVIFSTTRTNPSCYENITFDLRYTVLHSIFKGVRGQNTLTFAACESLVIL